MIETSLQGIFFRISHMMIFIKQKIIFSHPSGQMVESYESNNISKTQHSPTIYVEDMIVRTHCLLLSGSSKLSYSLFSLIPSLISHVFSFFQVDWLNFFFVLKAFLSLIIILSLVYAFKYFI
jgi:hypothetical protein